MPREYTVRLPRPHEKQEAFVDSTAKRNVVRAGRRGGKTVGVAIRAVKKFLAGKRVLYAAPTQEQIDRFWVSVVRALQEPIDAGVFHKNETRHIIELPGTEQRIRAKTAWNADTLRGDYADELILDEWQLMNEDAWGIVGAPMLMDTDGNVTFIYTPPSLKSRSVSKADDPQHAAKLYKNAKADVSGDWATFHFTSRDNPHIKAEAIDRMASDMTSIAYRMEVLAEDVDEAPGALWTRHLIEKYRLLRGPDYDRIVVSVDPSATSTGNEAGIITAGMSRVDGYLISDDTLQGSPKAWATAAVTAYHKHKADCIVAEANNGGEMVALTIATVDPDIKVKLVHASRGKQTRAEPVSALYEHGRVHHIGSYPALEDEMCLWLPGDESPNRMDALVWAFTELMLGSGAVGPVDDQLADQLEMYRGR
jgi:phage terminase large subunit-like protein